MLKTTVRLLLVTVCLFKADTADARTWDELRELERFRFWVVSDMQIGALNSTNPNDRVPNAALRSFVQAANTAEVKPDFLVLNGNLVAYADKRHFEHLTIALEQWHDPVLMVRGQSDGSGDNRFFEATQSKLGQSPTSKQVLWVGPWRLITLPSLAEIQEPQAREQTLDWLRSELNRSQAPTMVFHHYPALPLGLTALLENPAPMTYRRQLLDTLTQSGNVQYVFSGAARTGVKTSSGLSRSYRGVSFVTTPTSTQPRRIDDEFSQFLVDRHRTNDNRYFLEVNVTANQVELYGGKSNAITRVAYPALEAFEPQALAGWFNPIGTLPAAQALDNGGFEQGLDAWRVSHRYRRATSPAIVAHSQQRFRLAGQKALELAVNPVEAGAAREESVEVYQLLDVKGMAAPTFTASYAVPGDHRSHFGGGYARFQLYAEERRVFSVVLHWGARESKIRHLPAMFAYSDEGVSSSLETFHAQARRGDWVFYEMPDGIGAWDTFTVNLAQMFEMYHPGAAFSQLRADKALAAFGVWSGPDRRASAQMLLDEVSMSDWTEAVSEIGRKPLRYDTRHQFAPYGSWYLD